MLLDGEKNQYKIAQLFTGLKCKSDGDWHPY